MNKYSRSTISEYMTWFVKLFQDYHQEIKERTAYRIINIKQNKKGVCKLTIHIAGKNSTFNTSPLELAADDSLLDNFSSRDVRTITYLACQETNKPKYKILIREFCGKLNKMVFHVQEKGSNKIEKKSATEISQNEKILAAISPKEAHMIGYASAEERNTEAINTSKKD